jgi:hypothetical protein
MELGRSLVDLWQALGAVDNDMNVKRELDENIPVEAAASRLISRASDLDTATRELHDHAYSVKHARNIEEAFELVAHTNEIYDRLLGRSTKKDGGRSRK